MDESTIFKLYASELEKTINSTQLYPVNTYEDIPGMLPYVREIRSRHNYHNGQRKLMLTEVEFLTIMKHTKAKYFIYAGSAPGWKDFYLYLLFTELKFILVDPNPFRVFIYADVPHTKVGIHEHFLYLDSKKP